MEALGYLEQNRGCWPSVCNKGCARGEFQGFQARRGCRSVRVSEGAATSSAGDLCSILEDGKKQQPDRDSETSNALLTADLVILVCKLSSANSLQPLGAL